MQKCYSDCEEFCGSQKEFYRSALLGGYHVSAVGRDEKVIREYIKKQEEEDQRFDQLNLFD